MWSKIVLEYIFFSFFDLVPNSATIPSLKTFLKLPCSTQETRRQRIKIFQVSRRKPHTNFLSKSLTPPRTGKKNSQGMKKNGRVCVLPRLNTNKARELTTTWLKNYTSETQISLQSLNQPTLRTRQLRALLRINICLFDGYSNSATYIPIL